MEILLHFGLGVLGILLYTLFKAKDYIFNNEFVLYTLVEENWKSWVWSLLVVLTIAVTVYLEPSVKDTLRAIFAIDLDASPTGFFLLGASINLVLKSNQQQAKRTKRKVRKTV